MFGSTNTVAVVAPPTRARLPVRLVWSQEFERVSDAFAFEKQVQNWGRAKRLALIEGRLGANIVTIRDN